MSGVIEIWHGVPVLVAQAPVASNAPVSSTWLSADGRQRKVVVKAVDELGGSVHYQDMQNKRFYEKPIDRFFQQFNKIVTSVC